MGATASKKCSPSPAKCVRIYAAIGSEVSGPVATTVICPSGIADTSSSTTVMRGWAQSFSVIYAENLSRSTARAEPAATCVARAASMMSEPIRDSSSLSSPTALLTRSERRELEQTSSAKSGEWCAGV